MWQILIFIIALCLCKADIHIHTENEKMSGNNADDQPIPIADYLPIINDGLARLNGHKVGYKQMVHVGGGKTLILTTKAMRPLLFEIQNFLSPEEVDNIIRRAKDPNEGGMFQSIAKGGLTRIEDYEPLAEKGRAPNAFGSFEFWDADKDGKLVLQEIVSAIHSLRIIILTEEDLNKMFKALEISAFEDGEITRDEFDDMDTIGVQNYVNMLYRNNPRYKERHSEQAWLFMEQWIDPVIHNIRERVVKITALDRKTVYGGERLQVLRYEPHGHYNGHYDSETHERQDLPCCHQYPAPDMLESVGKCRLCRYITFFMYLNDVEEGGETAFPAADNQTYSHMRMRSIGDHEHDLFNLHDNCKKGNLVVTPRKGTAIMWYNHLRNETDGWMGAMDEYGIHGGCAVLKGEKWVANMWLTAPYGFSKDIPSIYLNPLDYEMAAKEAAVSEQLESMKRERDWLRQEEIRTENHVDSGKHEL